MRVTTIIGTRQQPSNPLEQMPSRPIRPVPSGPAPTPADRAAQLHDIDDVLDHLDTAIADAGRRWSEILARLEQ